MPLALLNLAGAVITHVRVKDVKNIPVPAALLAFAALTLADASA
ncbi:hypothetical protein AB0K00_13830 [Dactylosporangium sp. NPDC049525]